MRLASVAVVLAALVAVVGCGGDSEPRIDGGSQEAFGASLEAVGKSLPEDPRQEFERALASIVADEFGDLGDVAGRLDGMTAAEVIEEAEGLQPSPMAASAMDAARRAADRSTAPPPPRPNTAHTSAPSGPPDATGR